MRNREIIKNKVQTRKENQKNINRNKNVIRRQISSNNFKYEKIVNNKQNKNGKRAEKRKEKQKLNKNEFKNRIKNENNIRTREIKGYKEPEEVKKGKINAKTVLAVLIIITLTFIILYRESMLEIKAKEIKSLKESNKKIEKENSQIELSFQSALSLNNIEKSASEKLGMKKQSKDNTVYLKIDVEDFIEPVVVTKIEREDKSFFKKIYNNILDFFGNKGKEQSNVKIKEHEKMEQNKENVEEKNKNENENKIQENKDIKPVEENKQ